MTRIDLTMHVEGHDSFVCGDMPSFYYTRSLPPSCKRVNRVSLDHAQPSSSEQQHPYREDAEVNSYFHQGITTCHGIDLSHEVMHMHRQPNLASHLASDDVHFTTGSPSVRLVADAHYGAQISQSFSTPALSAWLPWSLPAPIDVVRLEFCVFESFCSMPGSSFATNVSHTTSQHAKKNICWS
jgi:hypothetical protein